MSELLPEPAKLSVRPNVNGAAYSLYLRARELETHSTQQDLLAARDLYADAIAADRSFAQAHARYAIVLTTLGQQEKAKVETEETLRLDPNSGEGRL